MHSDSNYCYIHTSQQETISLFTAVFPTEVLVCTANQDINDLGAVW
jgi:hypothetical protein